MNISGLGLPMGSQGLPRAGASIVAVIHASPTRCYVITKSGANSVYV